MLEKIKEKMGAHSGDISKKEYLAYGVVIVLVLVFAFLAMYPGYASSDSAEQMAQVTGGVYSNWHPVIQTLFSFRLPTLLFSGSWVACTIFQEILIGLALLYFCRFLRKYLCNFWVTLGALLLIVANPTFMRMSVTLWKDLPFSWCIFMVSVFIMEIVITKGEWLKNNAHKIFLVLALLGITFFRHNGIISTIVIVFGFLIFFKDYRKFLGITIVAIVAGRMLLYGPVYQSLGVKDDGGKAEMIGIPMNQIAYLYHNNLIVEDDVKILEELAPKEVWEEHYSSESFNWLKWAVGNDYAPWAEENFSEIMKIWVNGCTTYPMLCLKSFAHVTSTIWGISTNGIEHTDVGGLAVVENPPQIVAFANKIFLRYVAICSKLPLVLVFCNGTSFWVIIAAGVWLIFKRGKLTAFLPFVPVLSNTFLMILLVTGGESRFVYSQMILAVPLLLYVAFIPKYLCKKQNSSKIIESKAPSKNENSISKKSRKNT